MLKKIKDIMGKKKNAKTDQENVKDEVLTEDEVNNSEDQNDSSEEMEANEEEKELSPLEQLQLQVEELNQEKAELKDKHLRLFAEFDNYKKRNSKQLLDMQKTASSNVLKTLLPILDDYDRAKKNADDENNDEVWSEGVVLVFNKLHAIVAKNGLTVMESTGLEFDPDLHEAITEIPVPDEEMKGKVVDTVEKGYKLNDIIIRHAKVVVGK